MAEDMLVGQLLVFLAPAQKAGGLLGGALPAAQGIEIGAWLIDAVVLLAAGEEDDEDDGGHQEDGNEGGDERRDRAPVGTCIAIRPG